MKSIEEIYYDFKAKYNPTPDVIINVFSENSILLNNKNSFSNVRELKFFIEIICNYISALYEKGYWNKSLQEVEKFKPLIDTEIKKFDAENIKDNWYYGLDFIKGMALYNLKNYNAATKIFEKLVSIDSKNDRFKSWLNHSRINSYERISNILLLLVFILYALNWFFGKKIFSSLQELIVIVFFFVIFISIGIFKIYNRRKLDLLKKSINC